MKQQKLYKELMPVLVMETQEIKLPRAKFEELKRKAEMNEELLISLVRGLEDIKEGRIKSWQKSTD